jgi:tRNA(fMet)-specific endonuclease VapC
MYLLDTTHCLGALFGFPNVRRKLENDRYIEISTNVIVRCELIYGAYKSEQVTNNLQRIEIFLKALRLFNIDEETADICAKLKIAILKLFGPEERNKLRNTTMESLGFGSNDLWIAATAIQHNLILVSADSDLLRLNGVEGLQVENW